jgi:H+/Cl- antiporter ClcA
MNVIDDRSATTEQADTKQTDAKQQLVRQEAIKQIERRRRFRLAAVASSVGIACLIAIWAVTEYHNAGGWPTHGFSQSSGIHDVWNFWIIYPVGAWLAILATHAWYVYMRRPISERDIDREIGRQQSDPGQRG